MIKVLHLIWSMESGGAQQIVINYFRDFQTDSEIEMKLVVFCASTSSKYDKEIKEKGYSVRYLNNPSSFIKIPIIKRYFNRKVARAVWEQVIREERPDIVHVHVSGLLQDTINALVKNNVPVIFDTLHSNPHRYKGNVLDIIKRSFNEFKVIPICVTEEQSEDAKVYYGIKEYEIVRNGVDLDNIRNKIVDKNIARELLGVGKDTFVILGVGRLNPIKRFSILIKATCLIREVNNNCMLIIVGEGSEREKLENLASKLGISENVIFAGNQENVIPYYCAADVLGVTSTTESSSLVALEAQICGLRCVLSNGVPNETIISNNTRRMQDEVDINIWAEALMDCNYRGDNILTAEDYDVHNISRIMKKIYKKRWNEYENR